MSKLSVLKRGIFKQSMSKHFYVSMDKDKPNRSNQRTEAEYV
jgi:hypothetical protein